MNLGHNNHIKDCPFCGSKEGEDVFLGYKYPHYIISCGRCSVRMKQDRKDKAIGLWNNRKLLED